MQARIFALKILAGGALLLAASSSVAKGQKEENAVLAAVQSLLNGWREADVDKVEAALHPDFREVTMHLNGEDWAFSTMSRASLTERISKLAKGVWDDQLVDPQVHVDGPIAVVWSHYRFTVRYTEDGVAHAPVHCGIETFQLYRTKSAWKIVNFADTHSDACS